MSVITVSEKVFDRMETRIKELEAGGCRYRCRIGNYTDQQLLKEVEKRGLAPTDSQLAAKWRKECLNLE